jgi:hypothetical protein
MAGPSAIGSEERHAELDDIAPAPGSAFSSASELS